MEQASNTFTSGLQLDVNEISVLNTMLTDVLNATLLTGNGNEMLLQNDMGNTMIEDARTGHLMALRDGFIPVGMKEHGGVLYIASYNPHTKLSQLGSIPSPNITYLAKNKHLSNINALTKIRTSDNISLPLSQLMKEPVKLFDEPLSVGDAFIVQLNLPECEYDLTENSTDRYITTFAYNDNNYTTYKYPLVTYKSTAEGDNKIYYGYYRLKLYIGIPGYALKEYPNYDSFQQLEFFLKNDLTRYKSKRWFINYAGDLNIDYNRTELFLKYPNIPKGYLYIKAEPELPSNFTGYCDVSNTGDTDDFINFYLIPDND